MATGRRDSRWDVRYAGVGCLALALVCVAACGGATRAALRTSIDEVSQVENWDKLRAPARGLSEEVARGVLDGLTGSERAKAIEGLLDVYVNEFLGAVAEGIDTKVGPAVARQVRASVAGVLDEMLNEQRRRDAGELVARVTSAAVNALGSGLARQLRNNLGPALAAVLAEDLGPALRQTLEQQLGPGLEHVLREQLGPALQHVLENNIGPGVATALERSLPPTFDDAVERTAYAATRGSLRAAKDQLGSSIQLFEAKLAGGQKTAKNVIVYLIVSIVLAVAVGILLLMFLFQRRESRNVKHSLRLVAGQIRDMHHKPGVQELVTRIKQAGMSHAGGQALASFLSKHPGLKARAKAENNDGTGR